MQITLPGQIFGLDSLKSKAGRDLTIIKALINFGERQDAVRFFMPNGHPALKGGPHNFTCEVQAPLEGFGLVVRLVSAVPSAAR